MAARHQEKKQSVRPQVEPCGHPRKKTKWPSAKENLRTCHTTFKAIGLLSPKCVSYTEKKLTHKLQRGPTTWNDMLENTLSGTVNQQTKQWSNFTKFRISVWMIINSNRKKSNLLENCQKFAHKLFKCLYLARIGRPDILWSVNKLERSVTK